MTALIIGLPARPYFVGYSYLHSSPEFAEVLRSDSPRERLALKIAFCMAEARLDWLENLLE